MLANYFMTAFNNGANFISTSAVSQEAAVYYGVTELDIEWFIKIFLIMTGVGSPAILIVRKSLYWGMFVSIVLTAAGATLKYAAGTHYGLALTGQFLVSATTSLTLSANLVVPVEWFLPELHIRSTTIAGLGSIVGFGFGLFGSVYTSVPTFNLSLACIAMVCLVVYLLTGRHSPFQQNSTSSIIEALYAIKDNCYLITVICLSSTIIGTIYTYLGLIGALLAPLGLSVQDIGLSGGLFVLSGVAGCSLSNWLGETKGIVYSLRVFLVCTIISFGGLAFSSSDFVAFSVMNALVGFFLQGTMMIALSAVSNNSYPTDNTLVSCIIYVVADSSSFISTSLVDLVTYETSMSGLCLLALLVASVGLPLVGIYKLKEEDESAAKTVGSQGSGMSLLHLEHKT
jgi:hypothetical protein